MWRQCLRLEIEKINFKRATSWLWHVPLLPTVCGGTFHSLPVGHVRARHFWDTWSLGQCFFPGWVLSRFFPSNCGSLTDSDLCCCVLWFMFHLRKTWMLQTHFPHIPVLSRTFPHVACQLIPALRASILWCGFLLLPTRRVAFFSVKATPPLFH